MSDLPPNSLGFDHIFSVYTVIPNIEGTPERRLAGRFTVHSGFINVLQDYFGLLHDLQGPLTAESQAHIDSLKNSMHTIVVSDQDWMDGRHPELIPYHDLIDNSATVQVDPDADGEKPLSRFSYQVHGGDPFELHVRNNAVLLNGQPIEDHQTQHLLNALEQGLATCTRQDIVKSDDEFVDDLIKAEPNLSAALEALRGAVKAGTLPREHMRAISNALYKDSMVPKLGNKASYQDFVGSPKAQKGVHLVLDSNNFKKINDLHGHAAGDMAIKNYGNAIADALKETTGRSGYAARPGGDEFHVHLPTSEHAANFSRSLRQKLEALPPVGGTHGYSMSVGMGSSPEQADQAMYHAKSAKNAAQYPEGQAKTHVHSLLPGKEGPIPVGNEKLTAFHPPTPISSPPTVKA